MPELAKLDPVGSYLRTEGALQSLAAQRETRDINRRSAGLRERAAQQEQTLLNQKMARQTLDDMGRAALWADTPEKWEQALDTYEGIGMDVSPYRGRFELRETVAGLATGNQEYALKQLDMRLKEAQTKKAEAEAEDFLPEKEKKEEKERKDIATKLRGEFTKITKNFAEINDAYGRVQASAKNPSAAGDLALIFNYMKMLDPESVVRESEFATAAQAGSYGARIQALVNRTVSGQRLSEVQRNDFVDRSKKLYETANDIHQGREDEYKRLAKRYKVDPEDVIIKRSFFDINEPSSSPNPAPAEGWSIMRVD